jgi:hypothetical protein
LREELADERIYSMKVFWLPALALIALIALMAVSPPTSAQLAGTGPPSPGSYSWGPYVVTRDGILHYDDIGIRCEELIEQGTPLGSWSDKSPPPEPLMTVEAAELCKEAGFPPSGGEMVMEDLAVDEEGRLVGPRPKEYRVTEDGTLIIEGDVYLIEYCRLFAEGSDLFNTEKEEYAEACTEAGFSRPGNESATLPETGGVHVAVIVVAASVLVGSVLVRTIVR